MRQITAILLSAAVLLFTAATLLAHEVTYKGTVISAEAGQYAQLDGSVAEIQEIQVKVIDDRSKKETPMVFTVTDKTSVFRGDMTVSFAEAHIQKDERVAVTIDHDKPGDDALEIRLAPRK